jgi:hypothetical protein
MKHIEAFLGAREKLEEQPAEVVRLAASALLEVSLLRGDKPERAKKGVPIYGHRIPTARDLIRLSVKPHLSSYLSQRQPIIRARAAETPASMNFVNGMFMGVSFSFDVLNDVVAVELNKDRVDPCGESSTTERGLNTIRNAWQNMHLPTIAYVEQAAASLPQPS